jgi:non-homologous end joining protein Ku
MISRNNAQGRIEQNELLLEQVDRIITNYTNNLASKNNAVSSERIILDNQEQVNIADLFEYKNLLIRDIEIKKLELAEQTQPISIINFGKSHEVQKSFFGKNLVLIPSMFILIFLFVSFLFFLNKKSKSIV